MFVPLFPALFLPLVPPVLDATAPLPQTRLDIDVYPTIAQNIPGRNFPNNNFPDNFPGNFPTPTGPPILLPDSQPAGSLLRIDLSRNWRVYHSRLPLSTRLNQLIALDVILPEYGFLANNQPDCSSDSCVLFSISGPSGVPNPGPTAANAAKPPVQSNPGLSLPSNNIAAKPSLSCQSQVRQIRQKRMGDRQASVYQQLLQCYQDRLVEAKTANQALRQTHALNNLGVTAYILGQYKQAIAYHQQQIKIAAADQNEAGVGMALAGIGAAHGALGDYEKALIFYEQALAKFSQESMAQWRALVLRNIGNAYLTQSQVDTAIKQQLKSLAISRKIGDRYGQAQAHGNLGNAYAQNSDFAASIEAYQTSHEIAIEINDRLQVAQALLGLGTTHTYQRKFDTAVDYHQRSLALMRELKAQLGEGITLTNLGDVLLRLQRFEQSETHLTNAIKVWESLRAGLGNNDAFKVSLFETQLDAYRNLQETLIAQNKPEPALEIAERGRARAFIELLARGTTNEASASIVRPPSIEQIRQIALQQKSTIVQYSIIRDQFVPVKHGGAVQFTAEPRESAIFIWVVKPTGQVTFRRVALNPNAAAENSLGGLVKIARNAIGKRLGQRRRGNTPTGLTNGRSQFLQFRQLHQLLIEPIADLLPRDPNDRVVFAPQEQLFLVPFAALQSPQNKFLIEQHTILTTPSIQVLGLERSKPRNQRQSTLIVGNPTPMPSGFDALPGAATEAQAIGNLLNVSPLVGARATEASIKSQLANARIIHLATHGVFSPQQPLQGWLALAPSGQEDGLLTAAEMLKLPINADLVVLSACDTGRGRITGDGVLGLSRSWMAAGAASVVVSLWAIDDKATSGFMVEFYRSLQQQSDKAAALRSAMLKTLKTHPEPEIWAAFNLIGEPD
ncbi:CHAT domain-containing protein [filamentous cyanobacterium LEGE 11480]|uniref:CHAT domain-containing protein n=1 Tax=Romeriopsis navalis LEGE 11480 TaxID=2777977 RepID=A0A928VPA1_9CYAN|nr:CHAT domain-containing tetratricopeptide repeat protein [Romeriopsis navalis]MBE9029559.1 CHAT domain-containing protein [Romeriopsis navalis LEGE 11480]